MHASLAPFVQSKTDCRSHRTSLLRKKKKHYIRPVFHLSCLCLLHVAHSKLTIINYNYITIISENRLIWESNFQGYQYKMVNIKILKIDKINFKRGTFLFYLFIKYFLKFKNAIKILITLRYFLIWWPASLVLIATPKFYSLINSTI